MTEITQDLLAGARNMLVGCGKLKAGDRVLVVVEEPALGYYDDILGQVVVREATSLGVEATVLAVPFRETVDTLDPEVSEAMRAADLTVFLARLGDQIRFDDMIAGCRALVCYALDRDMLASPFGRLDYTAFSSFRTSVDAMFAAADKIRVTCQAGTDFSGSVTASVPPKDTNTLRFPLSVFTPIPARGFSGSIALRGFLVGTGSAFYTPYACRIEDTLIVNFRDNRILGFEGKRADVSTAQAFYESVSARYQLDTYFIHSWHGGIHPGCSFNAPANDSFERWSGGAFGNPRLMHFHSCGAYAPGEISLNILDATIAVDGANVWEKGRLEPGKIPGAKAILDAHPEMRAVFGRPARECGEGSGGGLTFD